MTITIRQISNATSYTIGEQILTYSMTQLTPIYLVSALRNTSNYNSQIQINITLNVSINETLLSVALPSSQVYPTSGSTCFVNTPSSLSNVNCSS